MAGWLMKSSAHVILLMSCRSGYCDLGPVSTLNLSLNFSITNEMPSFLISFSKWFFCSPVNPSSLSSRMNLAWFYCWNWYLKSYSYTLNVLNSSSLACCNFLFYPWLLEALWYGFLGPDFPIWNRSYVSAVNPEPKYETSDGSRVLIPSESVSSIFCE